MTESIMAPAIASVAATVPAAPRSKAAATTDATARLRRSLAALYRLIRRCLALLGLYMILFTFVFDLGKIVSPSMQPTLQGTSWEDGDWVLSENISYWFRTPRRWEIVRLRAQDGLMIMKRIAGLPGEKVQLVDGKLVINGQMRPAPPELKFLHYYAYGPHARGGKTTDCGGGYFVLGDDSKDSQDSRYDGPIDPKCIYSRAVLRVWPVERIGWITPGSCVEAQAASPIQGTMQKLAPEPSR